MAGDFTAQPANDPESLVDDVERVSARPDAGVPAQRSMLEEDIRRAYRTIEDDLQQIDILRDELEEIPYLDIFGHQLHDKLAAIVYIAKHKLYDVTYGSAQALETIDARRDLSGMIEILFLLQAVDGLMILYDFSVSQQALHDAAIWQNISHYYLRLIAMMPEPVHARIVAFLKERPVARRHVEQLMASPDPATANQFRLLGEEYLRTRNESSEIDDLAASTLYARLYYQFDQHAPDEQTLGLTAMLAAENRIRQAVKAGDTATVAKWICEGSLVAARLAFQLARGDFNVWVYATLLGQLLQRKELSPTILTAVVLELGNLNKLRNGANGEMEINQLLADFTLVDDANLAGVARVAVWKLREVNALNEVVMVVEKAPLLAVAEEGLRALRDMRYLQLADPIIQHRPELQPAYTDAQDYLRELQSLMTAIWGCRTAETMVTYLSRLKALNAIPELEQLSEQHPIFSELARLTRAELE